MVAAGGQAGELNRARIEKQTHLNESSASVAPPGTSSGTACRSAGERDERAATAGCANELAALPQWQSRVP